MGILLSTLVLCLGCEHDTTAPPVPTASSVVEETEKVEATEKQVVETTVAAKPSRDVIANNKVSKRPAPANTSNAPNSADAKRNDAKRNDKAGTIRGDKAGVKIAANSEPPPVAEPSPPKEPAAAAGKGDPALDVRFPFHWRTWRHVKSMVIHDAAHPLFEAFGGIHHIYANKSAFKALQQGTSFPDGATFAFDLLAISEDGGAYVEKNRKFVAVMTRDRDDFKKTSGWGWQAWADANPNRPALKTLSEQATCATCHDQVQAQHFVFTQLKRDTCSIGDTKGVCKPTGQCTGTVTPGLCPGPRSIRCCTGE